MIGVLDAPRIVAPWDTIRVLRGTWKTVAERERTEYNREGERERKCKREKDNGVIKCQRSQGRNRKKFRCRVHRGR